MLLACLTALLGYWKPNTARCLMCPQARQLLGSKHDPSLVCSLRSVPLRSEVRQPQSSHLLPVVDLQVGVDRLVSALLDGLGQHTVDLSAPAASGAHEEDAVSNGKQLRQLHHPEDEVILRSQPHLDGCVDDDLQQALYSANKVLAELILLGMRDSPIFGVCKSGPAAGCMCHKHAPAMAELLL